MIGDGAGGDEDGKVVDDGVAAMAGGAGDVGGVEDERGVADGADEEVEGGLRELHGLSLSGKATASAP